MNESIHGRIGGLALVGSMLISVFIVPTPLMSGTHALAGASLIVRAAQKPGPVARGRAVFNGKGICYYCHGVDGHPDQLPQLEQETASVVARLSPVPVDLRNLSMLKLKSDKERFRAIREGHPGAGMLPDKTLTDQEINDTLAYLALLRREGAQNVGEARVPHPKERP